MTNMAPLTVAEVEQHPGYAGAIWHLPATKKGKLSVGQGRGGPFDIAWELHGHGPIRLVWIMGLGSFKMAWQRQTKDFGHDRAETYSSLIFDNRGMGESDKPLVRYSTSEMAKDTVELLDHLGWTDPRSVHVTGVSMGGMIAQELGLLIPERIASLSLVSTAARLVNTIGFVEHLRNRINLFIPRSLDRQLALTKLNLFPPAFLDAPDTEGIFPTNGDAYTAQDLHKRRNTTGFTRKGFILQAIAAGWHHKSAEQIRQLADAVGRHRIQVMHGTLDRMISPPHGDVLASELGGPGPDKGVRYTVFGGCGHVLIWEKREEVRKLIEQLIHETHGLEGI
ncbi:MAG: hypothetical protein M1825_006378 [Sarcosagium campestre]|nr:MAG: hypothetical protein M1825_006378 [Sarcosagium campestre]